MPASPTVNVFAGDDSHEDPLGGIQFPNSLVAQIDASKDPISVLCVVSKVSGAPTVTLESTQADAVAGAFPVSPFPGGMVGGWTYRDGFCGGAAGGVHVTGTVAILADIPSIRASIALDLSALVAAGAAADGETLIFTLGNVTSTPIAATFTWKAVAPDLENGEFNSGTALGQMLAYVGGGLYLATSGADASHVTVSAVLDTSTLVLTGTAAPGGGGAYTVGAVVTGNSVLRDLLTQFPALAGETLTVSTLHHENVAIAFGREAGQVATLAQLEAAFDRIGYLAALVGGFLDLTSSQFLVVAAGAAATTLGLAAGTYSPVPAGGALFSLLPGVADGDTIVLDDGTHTVTLTMGSGGGHLDTVAAVNAALAAATFNTGVLAAMDQFGNLTFTAADGSALNVTGTGGFESLVYIGVRAGATTTWVPHADVDGVPVTAPIPVEIKLPYKGCRIRVSGGSAKLSVSQAG